MRYKYKIYAWYYNEEFKSYKYNEYHKCNTWREAKRYLKKASKEYYYVKLKVRTDKGGLI